MTHPFFCPFSRSRLHGQSQLAGTIDVAGCDYHHSLLRFEGSLSPYHSSMCLDDLTVLRTLSGRDGYHIDTR